MDEIENKTRLIIYSGLMFQTLSFRVALDSVASVKMGQQGGGGGEV